MKKQIIFLSTLFLSLNCFSQITFDDGYFINNTNQKIFCLIKNVDWKNNPIEFEYKLSENGEPKKAYLNSVKEFGIANFSKYIRNTVNIDRSSNDINDLSSVKNPIFKEEQLFLEVLVEGKYTLYQYVDGSLKRYFYNEDNADVEQLIFKRYKNPENKIGTNNRFRQQLWNDLKCSEFKKSKYENLDYRKSEFVSFFVAYNKCNNEDYVNYEEKENRDLFNLTFRPRLNSSFLTIQNTVSNAKNYNFENEISFGFGIEAEFILPFNKNKWAIIIEPTYQRFKSEETIRTNDFSSGISIGNVDYTSVEIPVGFRHYFFLNNNSKIFVNASYVFDISSKSTIEFSRIDGFITDSLEVVSRGGNLAMGVGYKQNDRYSIEFRFQTNRDLLNNYAFWTTEYSTFSIILGYSIF